LRSAAAVKVGMAARAALKETVCAKLSGEGDLRLSLVSVTFRRVANLEREHPLASAVPNRQRSADPFVVPRSAPRSLFAKPRRRHYDAGYAAPPRSHRAATTRPADGAGLLYIPFSESPNMKSRRASKE